MTVPTKSDYQIISKISNRAMRFWPGCREKIDFDMDLEAVHETIGLRLQALLDAPDYDFAHDVGGITEHLNRNTKELEDCFLPRFSA